MGNRIFQYFLSWVCREAGREWPFTHIHGLVALGGVFLGAPKVCFVLFCVVLYCIVLYCIVLYCIVLYCIVLCCVLCCVLF
jgi:hypothetical protein